MYLKWEYDMKNRKQLLCLLALILCMALTACSMRIRFFPGGMFTEPPPILGTLEDNIYTQEFFGLRLELNDSWTYLSDEELEKSPAEAAALVEGGIVYDLTAELPCGDRYTSGIYCPTVIDDHAFRNNPEEFIDREAETFRKEYEEYIETEGIREIRSGRSTVTFLGETVPCVALSYVVRTGQTHYVRVVYRENTFRGQTYMFYLIAESYNEDRTLKMIKAIEPLDE